MKIVQKKSGLVRGNKPGFSFLELTVVLLILAVVAAVAVPNLLRKDPQQQRQLFVQQFDNLIEEESTRALLSGIPHKILLNTHTKELSVMPEQQKNDTKDAPNTTVVARLAWPEHLDIEQFYIQGADEFAVKNSGKETDTVWFYVVPDGMAQEVIINGKDTKDVRSVDEIAPWSFVLNPFTLRFKLYEEFQTPSF